MTQFLQRRCTPCYTTGAMLRSIPVLLLVAWWATPTAAQQSEKTQPGLRIRVLTYNIHHGAGVDGQLDLPRLAQVITAARPDVVALQEVDSKTRRSELVDQPAELARLTGMTAAFGGNIDVAGGRYGNAVLSRFPIVRQQNHFLPCFDDGEQRGLLEVELQLPEPHPSLLLLATHFDHRRDERERIASAEAVNQLIVRRPPAAAVLAGDLNATPNSLPLLELGKHWTRANKEILPTIPVTRPRRQIDYVMLLPASRWRVLNVTVLDEAIASDHRALLAELELQSASGR